MFSRLELFFVARYYRVGDNQTVIFTHDWFRAITHLFFARRSAYKGWVHRTDVHIHPIICSESTWHFIVALSSRYTISSTLIVCQYNSLLS